MVSDPQPHPGPVESAILNFETILYNFISISIISQNFRTIRPVVTENSSEQSLGGQKKKNKKNEKMMMMMMVMKQFFFPLRLGELISCNITYLMDNDRELRGKYNTYFLSGNVS